MRTILIALAVVLLATSSAALASPKAEVAPGFEADGPYGDRWHDRWQGRRSYLEDDPREAQASTDGYQLYNRTECRNVAVRLRRTDGMTVIRRVNRCD